jgi:signal transduction histidine kinase
VSNAGENDELPSMERDRPNAQALLERALEDLRVQQVELELREEELRRAGERQQLFARSYDALFELSPLALIEVNGIGAVGRCNPAAMLAFPGIGAGVLLTELAVAPNGRDQLLSVVLSAQRQGRSAGLVEVGSRSFGVEAICVGSSERRTLVFMNDATEQIAARREAEGAAEQLRAISRAARDGVAVLHEGEVVYANEAWRKLASLIGRSARAFLDEAAEGESLAARLVRLAREGENRRLDACVGGSAAHQLQLEFSAVAMRYEGRDSVLVMARDLTARRQLEAQVSRNERLASLGMLVAGVAHEINNPLTYTLGNLESVAARLEGNTATLSGEEAREAIRDAIDGCQRIAAIIRELRSFHRSDAQDAAALDLNQVVRDAMRIVAPKCASLSRLEAELDEIPLVHGVQTSLVQVLINLIVNAVDAMSARDSSQNVVRITTGFRGRDVRIEVADNGPGIAPENLSRIFEPFFSQGKTSGTGLGLTISRNLVEQMNGWIDVDSRVGTGTRFVIHLEAARESAIQSSQPPALATSIIAAARILVVDDEPMVARSVSRLLASAREVICVHSVASALEQLTARSDIDLVLSDWVMPDGGAATLLRELQARDLGNIAFVVMTGLGQFDLGDPVDCPCVPKPVSRSALLATVSEALAAGEERRSAVLKVEPTESAAFLVRPSPEQLRTDALARRS